MMYEGEFPFRAHPPSFGVYYNPRKSFVARREKQEFRQQTFVPATIAFRGLNFNSLARITIICWQL
jgi:hypothetical protein